MSGPPSPLIEKYLREAGFWHVATIRWGCKLDLKLIRALTETWKYNCMLKIYLIRWNHSMSYAGIPIALEDIRLLLNQWSKAQFQWTPYKDPTIRAVIMDEFFQNPKIWHVKVSLVNYATVEIHQTDRDPSQAIFAIGRAEMSANLCREGTTGPFKSKEKG
ncbi:hypothetical protein Goari_019678 [Gossypium aridum]|uniref:Aminotransferase-like plant mobile domain-containing protein n=1 Tax=Gossypium aridum TaxID=34290 RepID=A0A7J8WUH5_GOSAI|nr:hypothetical protein [Gossypium aridum]